MTPDAARPTVGWRVNAERLVLLGWSRAILLQLAHPLVAAGVYDHSTVRQHPWRAATRLHHTVKAMLALTFGTEGERQAALEGILSIHRRVHGRLSHAAGRFPAGMPYSAEDPALVLWVHATLLESMLLAYELCVAPLGETDKDAYCAEAAWVAHALGARESEIPRSWRAMRECLDAHYTSGAIAVTPQARELASGVLAPPFAWMVAPLARLNRLVTAALLPPSLREAYGLEWSAADERRFARATARIRRLRRLLPDAVAWWPQARRLQQPTA